MSRPKKKEALKKSVVISTKLTESEYLLFKNKILRAKMEASEFLREVLNVSNISLQKRVDVIGLINDMSVSSIVRILLLQASVEAKFSQEEFRTLQLLANELQKINDSYAILVKHALSNNDTQVCFQYLNDINKTIARIIKR